MSEPSFSTEEKFLINYYKHNRETALNSLLIHEATFVFPTVLLLCFGAYYQSYTLAVCSILVYVVFRVREVFLSARYYGTISGIIEKFEARIAELSQDEKKSTSIRASDR